MDLCGEVSTKDSIFGEARYHRKQTLPKYCFCCVDSSLYIFFCSKSEQECSDSYSLSPIQIVYAIDKIVKRHVQDPPFFFSTDLFYCTNQKNSLSPFKQHLSEENSLKFDLVIKYLNLTRRYYGEFSIAPVEYFQVGEYFQVTSTFD